MVAETQPGDLGRCESSWGRRGPATGSSVPTKAIVGLAIMATGAILLLGQIGLIDTWGTWNYFWPLLFIGLGLSKLTTPRADGRRHGGGLLLIGAWLLLNNLHILRAGYSWPLFLVAWGLFIAWRAIAPRGSHTDVGQ